MAEQGRANSEENIYAIKRPLWAYGHTHQELTIRSLELDKREMGVEKREISLQLSAAKDQVNVLNYRVGERETTIAKKDEEIKSLKDQQAKHDAELKLKNDRIRILEQACEQKNKKIRWWENWWQEEKCKKQEKLKEISNGTHWRCTAVQTAGVGTGGGSASTKRK